MTNYILQDNLLSSDVEYRWAIIGDDRGEIFIMPMRPERFMSAIRGTARVIQTDAMRTEFIQPPTVWEGGISTTVDTVELKQYIVGGRFRVIAAFYEPAVLWFINPALTRSIIQR